MLKLLGAVLLMGGASAIGFSAAAHLRARVNCLRSLERTLEFMERELAFRLTPVPALFSSLARSAQEPASTFYKLCVKGLENLGEKPLNVLWGEALEYAKLPLQDDEARTLAELGDVLGQYDGEGQREALALTRERLTHFLERAEEERGRMEKVYCALGLSSGAFLLLVLL